MLSFSLRFNVYSLTYKFLHLSPFGVPKILHCWHSKA